MKKFIFLAMSIMINVLLLGFLLWHLSSQALEKKMRAVVGDQRDQIFDVRANSLKHTIAIVTPVTHPALEEIERGFKEALIKEYGFNCVFTVYNANGSRTLLRSQLEEIVQGHCDAIFTIGAMATQMAKEVTAKRKISKPIVFGAVADPVRLGIVQSLENSGNNITGTYAATNYQKQIELLLYLKPETKKLLLIYDPTQSSGLEKDKKEVEALLKEKGVAVKAVEVYHTHEIHQKIESLIVDVDVVMIFKDNTVVPAVDALIKQCSRHGVTLLTSDLDSVKKGAAMGFGVTEYEFGAASAHNISVLLREKKQPHEIPIFLVDKYRLKINTKTMENQGLRLEKRLLSLLKAVETL